MIDSYQIKSLIVLNPFLGNVPIVDLLEISENQRFSGVFRGYKMGTSAKNELTETLKMECH